MLRMMMMRAGMGPGVRATEAAERCNCEKLIHDRKAEIGKAR